MAFALSECDRTKVYIASKSGRIEHWNWVDGQRLTSWDVNAELYNLRVANLQDEGESHDVLFVADKNKGKYTITAHRFQKQGAESTAEVRPLLHVKEEVKHLQIIRNGQVIIASTGSQLVVGTRKGNKSSKHLGTLFYTWREIEYLRSITTLDGREAEANGTGSKKAKSIDVNIAVGTDEGAIYVYRDILKQFVHAESKISTPHASRLHWHRDAVGSVKWSADGNYVISGGNETVLIIWQLDTGKKQILPHLSASIEGVVVSPLGSSYAIRLADNSLMVLSTLELQPSVNIAGIQLPPDRSIKDPVEVSPLKRDYTSPIIRKRLAITATPDASQIMLAVPATVASRTEANQCPSSSCPYLQTIDTRSGSQISKQALVRTKVADRNIGPEGNVIEEPNVVLIRTSVSGSWLATVDEWAPPPKDVEFCTLGQPGSSEEQMRSSEVHLKFWSRNEVTRSWELSWRVDAPHKLDTRNSASSGLVLDMEMDPSKDGFFTLGEDGIVKGWYPKLRLRNGLPVRDHQGTILASWSGQVIGASSLSGTAKYSYDGRSGSSGKLAVSADGSVIAVGLATGPDTDLFTLSLDGSDIRQLSNEQSPSPVAGLGLIGKYLVFVGEHVVVWDLVLDVLCYAIKLKIPPMSQSQLVSTVHLCVNHASSTFAVVTGHANKEQTSRLAIFSPYSPSPIFSTQLPRAILGLVSLPTQHGYSLIDNNAEIQRITPSSHSPFNTREDRKDFSAAPTFTAIDSVFRSAPNIDQAPEAVTNQYLSPRTLDAESYSQTIAGHRQISDIWATNQAIALPPIETMFSQVAKLISRQQAKVA